MKNLSKVLNEKDIATKEYVDTASSNKANINSPTFTGSPTTPTPTQSTTGKVLVNQEYVANSVSGYLPLIGGTMTGSLVLNAAPTADLEAANKKYVDDTVLGAKPLAKELHFYGGCSSAANETNKVVTVSDDNFKLMSGVAVDVSFLNANTASRPTLNVNNTGAVEIKAYSTTVPLANQWRQGAVVRFVYNTSNWVMVDGSVASTTYYGATKLNSSTSSTSEDTAATPLAVKSAYDRGSTALTVASAAVPKSNLLRFTNVTFVANTGVTDTTYDGYAIRYDVSCTDVTTDYSADVRFAPADAVSGNFAPFCDTGNGIVKIYAKQAVKDNGGNITIPVIICTKMVD